MFVGEKRRKGSRGDRGEGRIRNRGSCEDKGEGYSPFLFCFALFFRVKGYLVFVESWKKK